jgi:hypothetical protein
VVSQIVPQFEQVLDPYNVMFKKLKVKKAAVPFTVLLLRHEKQ